MTDPAPDAFAYLPPDDAEAVPALGAIASYKDLRALIARRRRALGVPQREFDMIAGLPLGYVGKIEAGVRNLGPMSLGVILEGLGLTLIAIPTPPAKPVLDFIDERQRRLAKWTAAQGRGEFKLPIAPRRNVRLRQK